MAYIGMASSSISACLYRYGLYSHGLEFHYARPYTYGQYGYGRCSYSLEFGRQKPFGRLSPPLVRRLKGVLHTGDSMRSPCVAVITSGSDD